ncbi:MAG: LemA family protein [Nitriliruptor sp.]|uniref:LemA family protein n=1 Tax=Nitriliruptor sp. TaxID=2448056 RepID=UPI00349FFD5C
MLQTSVLAAVGVVVFVVIVTVLLHNRLVRARVRVDEAWAQVDTDLQRRHDLIPNVVATVGAYTDHEQAALTAVTSTRTAALTRTDAAGREAAEDELGAALGRLLVVAEAYPELEADAGFRDLQSELADTESRLSFARDFATHRVAAYHQLLETFPSVLVAGAFGFERRRMFATDGHEARRTPEVELGAQVHP